MRTPDCFSPDGQRLCLASDDRTVGVWDAITGTQIGQSITHSAAVSAAAFSKDGRYIYTASSDGLFRLFDAKSRKQLIEPIKHPKGIRQALIHPGDKLALTVGHDFAARLWNVESGTEVGAGLRHPDAINAAAFSNDGKLIVTASDDQTVQIWVTETGKPSGRLLKHPSAVRNADFGAGDLLAWTMTSDDVVRIWEVKTQALLHERIFHPGLSAADMQSSGNLVVTAGTDKLVRIWNASTGELIGEPFALEGTVSDVRFSPDGTLLVTACGDGRAQAWISDSGKPAGKALLHKAPVEQAGFDRAGKRVVTLSEDRAVRLWDFETGKLAGQPIRLASELASGGRTTHDTLNSATLTRVGSERIVTVGGITGVFTPITGAAELPLEGDERQNLLTVIDQLKREVGEVQSQNLSLQADLDQLRNRPASADDFASGVQQSVDELQQRLSTMRNPTSNFAVRELKLDASVYVQVSPLGAIEYRFVQPGASVDTQALSRLSLQLVPLPKDNTAGVWTTDRFQPDLPLAQLPGMTNQAVKQLESIGLFSIGEFLQVGTRMRTQAYLEALLDVERQRLAAWLLQASLLTLRGMTGAATLILIEAGLGQLITLADLTPAVLVERYEAVRLSRPDVQAPVIDISLARNWISAARQYVGLPIDVGGKVN